MAAISALRHRFVEFCERAGAIDGRLRSELMLALDEAATNIVRHGYSGNPGVIDVEFEANEARIRICLWDDGIERAEDDCIGLPPGTPGEGGMGLNLMRAMLTSIEYSRENGRNLLVLVRDVHKR
ncbi:MAG: ATP-binding protein [Planctomycetes bacterium]|nr:ATP-binding protein [Planctomycetota bacterium]